MTSNEYRAPEHKHAEPSEDSLPHSMYEISGQDAMTDHAIKRYMACKAYEDETLRRKAEEEKAKSIAQKIREGLEKDDPKIQCDAISAIWQTAKEERAALLSRAMDTKNPEAWRFAAIITVYYAPEKEKAALVRKVLGMTDPEAKRNVVDAIQSAPANERAALIREALAIDDPETQYRAGRMIRNAPEHEQEELRAIVIKNMREMLANDNPKTQDTAAKMFVCVSAKDLHPIQALIKEKAEANLASSNPENQRVGAEMMKCIPAEERPQLMQKALETNDPKTWLAAAKLISLMPDQEKDRFERLVEQKIETSLEENDPRTWQSAAMMIRYVSPTQERGLEILVREKIRSELLGNNPETQRVAAEMIRHADSGSQQSLFCLASEKGLGGMIVTGPLYDKHPNMNTETFSRHTFEKTGSGMTLVGGALKDKAIVRHIAPDAFLAWQELFENHALWKQAGFDYVPLEPILSYHIGKSGRVNVASGALDLTLQDWEDKTTLFNSEIEDQQKKIKKVLERIGFDHGHTHDKNFCLRFFRDAGGKVDFNRPPRVYLIDFDQAKAP